MGYLREQDVRNDLIGILSVEAPLSACHPERSERISGCFRALVDQKSSEMFRFAQHDTREYDGALGGTSAPQYFREHFCGAAD
jgi:hypothetical protein